jgi:hypothetical protein
LTILKENRGESQIQLNNLMTTTFSRDSTIKYDSVEVEQLKSQINFLKHSMQESLSNKESMYEKKIEEMK